MRRRLLRLGAYLLLGLVLAAAFLSGARETLTPQGLEALDHTPEIRGSTTVGQTFVAPFDGLFEVRVFLEASNPAHLQDLILHLRTGPEATEDLRTGRAYPARNKADPWIPFRFAPVPDSGGRSLYFFLESPLPEGASAPVARRSQPDAYREGTYYLDGAPERGDLNFKLFSRPGPIGWFRGVLRRLSEYKPSIWGQPECYGVLLLLYLVLLLLLVRRWASGESEDTTASTGGGGRS